MAGANSIAASASGRIGRILLLTGRLILGAIFVYAAYTKLHFDGAWHLHDYQFFFAMSIDAYHLLPLPVVQWMASVLPWVELTLGALLLTGLLLWWTAAMTSALLTIFMVALVHAMMLHLDICGCFGQHTVKPSDELLRDSGMLLVALAITWRAFLDHRSRRAERSPA
jgi:uncharacterized membrane protein YphA (DoxX/SURF4 family)